MGFTPSGVHFKDEGDGKPLVFIHGAFGSLEDWSDVASRLKGSFRLIAIDLKGHGKTTAKARCSVEDFAIDVSDVLSFLKLDKYVLVGFSLGGAVALRCSVARFKGLERLVLISPLIKGPPAMLFKLMQLLHRLGILDLRGQMEGKLFKELKNLEYDVASKIMNNLKSRSDREVFELARCVVNVDLRDMLSFVKVPALVLVGSNDKMAPIKLVMKACKKLPNFQMRVVENAGHMLIFERPGEVAQAIIDYLSE